MKLMCMSVAILVCVFFFHGEAASQVFKDKGEDPQSAQSPPPPSSGSPNPTTPPPTPPSIRGGNDGRLIVLDSRPGDVFVCSSPVTGDDGGGGNGSQGRWVRYSSCADQCSYSYNDSLQTTRPLLTSGQQPPPPSMVCPLSALHDCWLSMEQVGMSSPAANEADDDVITGVCHQVKTGLMLTESDYLLCYHGKQTGNVSQVCGAEGGYPSCQLHLRQAKLNCRKPVHPLIGLFCAVPDLTDLSPIDRESAQELITIARRTSTSHTLEHEDPTFLGPVLHSLALTRPPIPPLHRTKSSEQIKTGAAQEMTREAQQHRSEHELLRRRYHRQRRQKDPVLSEVLPPEGSQASAEKTHSAVSNDSSKDKNGNKTRLSKPSPAMARLIEVLRSLSGQANSLANTENRGMGNTTAVTAGLKLDSKIVSHDTPTLHGPETSGVVLVPPPSTMNVAPGLMMDSQSAPHWDTNKDSDVRMTSSTDQDTRVLSATTILHRLALLFTPQHARNFSAASLVSPLAGTSQQSLIREQNSSHDHREKNSSLSPREQDFNSGQGKQNFSTGNTKQNRNSSQRVQTVSLDPRQQNSSTSNKEQASHGNRESISSSAQRKQNSIPFRRKKQHVQNMVDRLTDLFHLMTQLVREPYARGIMPARRRSSTPKHRGRRPRPLPPAFFNKQERLEHLPVAADSALFPSHPKMDPSNLDVEFSLVIEEEKPKKVKIGNAEVIMESQDVQATLELSPRNLEAAVDPELIKAQRLMSDLLPLLEPSSLVAPPHHPPQHIRRPLESNPLFVHLFQPKIKGSKVKDSAKTHEESAFPDGASMMVESAIMDTGTEQVQLLPQSSDDLDVLRRSPYRNPLLVLLPETQPNPSPQKAHRRHKGEIGSGIFEESEGIVIVEEESADPIQLSPTATTSRLEEGTLIGVNPPMKIREDPEYVEDSVQTSTGRGTATTKSLKSDRAQERIVTIVQDNTQPAQNRENPQDQGMVMMQDIPQDQGMMMMQDIPQGQGMVMMQDIPQGQGMVLMQDIPQDQGMVMMQDIPQGRGMVMIQDIPQDQGMVLMQEIPQDQGMVMMQDIPQSRQNRLSPHGDANIYEESPAASADNIHWSIKKRPGISEVPQPGEKYRSGPSLAWRSSSDEADMSQDQHWNKHATGFRMINDNTASAGHNTQSGEETAMNRDEQQIVEIFDRGPMNDEKLEPVPIKTYEVLEYQAPQDTLQTMTEIKPPMQQTLDHEGGNAQEWEIFYPARPVEEVAEQNHEGARQKERERQDEATSQDRQSNSGPFHQTSIERMASTEGSHSSAHNTGDSSGSMLEGREFPEQHALDHGQQDDDNIIGQYQSKVSLHEKNGSERLKMLPTISDENSVTSTISDKLNVLLTASGRTNVAQTISDKLNNPPTVSSKVTMQSGSYDNMNRLVTISDSLNTHRSISNNMNMPPTISGRKNITPTISNKLNNLLTASKKMNMPYDKLQPAAFSQKHGQMIQTVPSKGSDQGIVIVEKQEDLEPPGRNLDALRHGDRRVSMPQSALDSQPSPLPKTEGMVDDASPKNTESGHMLAMPEGSLHSDQLSATTEAGLREEGPGRHHVTAMAEAGLNTGSMSMMKETDLDRDGMSAIPEAGLNTGPMLVMRETGPLMQPMKRTSPSQRVANRQPGQIIKRSAANHPPHSSAFGHGLQGNE